MCVCETRYLDIGLVDEGHSAGCARHSGRVTPIVLVLSAVTDVTVTLTVAIVNTVRVEQRGGRHAARTEQCRG